MKGKEEEGISLCDIMSICKVVLPDGAEGLVFCVSFPSLDRTVFPRCLKNQIVVLFSADEL